MTKQVINIERFLIGNNIHPVKKLTFDDGTIELCMSKEAVDSIMIEREFGEGVMIKND